MLNLWPPPPHAVIGLPLACPRCMSMLPILASCQWTLLPIHACPCSLAVHANAHVFAAWLYMPMPHVFAKYPLLFKTFCLISDLRLQDWTVYCNNKLYKLLSNCNYWLFGLLYSNSSLLQGIQQTETRLIVADKGNGGQPVCPRKWKRCERKNMTSNASAMYIRVPCTV